MFILPLALCENSADNRLVIFFSHIFFFQKIVSVSISSKFCLKLRANLHAKLPFSWKDEKKCSLQKFLPRVLSLINLSLTFMFF